MYGLGKSLYKKYLDRYETEGRNLIKPPPVKKFNRGGLMGAAAMASKHTIPDAPKKDTNDNTALAAFSLFKSFNEDFKK